MVDLSSCHGERGAKPPRRECRRLPTTLRTERPSASRVHEALLDADSFEDLPGKWQAAILKAEQNGPKLRVVIGD
jgi:hypothetical protein